MENMKHIARLAGLLYLLLAVIGPFSLMVVPDTLIVEGDAAATAANISADETLFRLGLLGEVGIFLIEVALVALLYIMFKPVNETLSLMAALARLSMTIIQGVNVVFGLGALLVLTDSTFATTQAENLALWLLNLREGGVLVWELFFALHLVVLGYLLMVSGYVPRLLGQMIIVASVGYAIHGVGTMLAPANEATFQTIVVVLAVIPEVSLTLWLLFRGVRLPARHNLLLNPA